MGELNVLFNLLVEIFIEASWARVLGSMEVVTSFSTLMGVGNG